MIRSFSPSLCAHAQNTPNRRKPWAQVAQIDFWAVLPLSAPPSSRRLGPKMGTFPLFRRASAVLGPFLRPLPRRNRQIRSLKAQRGIARRNAGGAKSELRVSSVPRAEERESEKKGPLSGKYDNGRCDCQLTVYERRHENAFKKRQSRVNGVGKRALFVSSVFLLA